MGGTDVFKGGETCIETEYIITSHALARELLNRPDGFITAMYNKDDEFIIASIQKVATHANIDDTITYWTLNLKPSEGGNVKYGGK